VAMTVLNGHECVCVCVVGIYSADSADVHVCVVRRPVVWWQVGSLQ